MKNKYFILGILLILISSPLGYISINILYINTNLTGEFQPLLNGFIHSFMIIGVLIFILGLIDKKIKK